MNDDRSSKKRDVLFKEQVRHLLPSLAATVPTNLPATRARLIGREREMVLIRAELLRDDVNLLTLIGLGGAGKTTLSVHAANTLLEMFSGGIFFIDLAPLTDHELILPTLAQTLNIQEELGRPIQDSLTDFLRGRSVLLLFDNFEHLLDGAPSISGLLKSNPLLKVMVTSREALRLQGEQVISIQPLTKEDAIELFKQRAQSLNPDFNLTDENIDAVSEICQKLDGLPLAIELAALRTKLLSPQTLLSRFQTALEPDSPILNLLTLGMRDLPARQQSLRSAIAWSYSLLNHAEQRVFRAASIFPAGFGLSSIQYIVNYAESDVFEMITSLVDKNLLKTSLAHTGEPRFNMLDTLREFGREQSVFAQESESDTDALIAWYLDLTDRSRDGLRSDKQNDWFSLLDIEYPNLIVILDWSLASERGSKNWIAGLLILDYLHNYWMLRCYFHFASRWGEHARISIEKYENDLSTLGKVQDMSRIKAGIYRLSGSLAWAYGRYAEAVGWHQASYQLFEEIDDRGSMADALNNMAVNQSAIGDLQSSYESLQNGLMLYREVGDRSGEMYALNNLGDIFNSFGRSEEARQCFQDGLIIAQELGDLYIASNFLMALAHVKVRAGEYANSISLLRQCFSILKGLQAPYIEAWAQIILGLAEIGLGKMDQAVSAVREGIRLAEDLADMDLKGTLLEVAISTCLVIHKPYAAIQLAGSLSVFTAKYIRRQYPADRLRHEKMIMQIRSLRKNNQFQPAWDVGLTASIQEALAFAREQLDERLDLKTPSFSQVGLTSREQSVLVLLAQGKSNEQIARELVVVLKTVEKHVANVLMKLGVKNRTEAAAWAIERNIIR